MPKIYDWEAHREVCRRMYVEEKRTLDEVVEFVRGRDGFGAR
jgi:hypothetical protein